MLGLPDGVRGCLFDPDGVLTHTAVREEGLRGAVVSSSANCHDVLVGAGIEDLFEVGVDRVGEAEALKEHGADIVVTDLAGPMEQ